MENISQRSLLEEALQIMEEKNGKVNIDDLINEVLRRKNLEDADGAYRTQLYVDITTSSKFVYMGDNEWDLKLRQSLDWFDKDGSAFNDKNEAEDDEEEQADEEILDDDDEEILDDEEDDDNHHDDDEDDDDKDEPLDLDMIDDEESLDDDSDDIDGIDDDFDEDKYDKYMDDYEDMYDEN